MGTDRLKHLTARQRAVYEFIREMIVSRGYGPTVREIGAQFDIRSPNGVVCHLKALERKGAIRREENLSRAIQLTEPVHSRGLAVLTLQDLADVEIGGRAAGHDAAASAGPTQG